jgi:hypothetical protein
LIFTTALWKRQNIWIALAFFGRLWYNIYNSEWLYFPIPGDFMRFFAGAAYPKNAPGAGKLIWIAVCGNAGLPE